MAITSVAFILQLADAEIADDGVVELLPVMVGSGFPGFGIAPLLLIAWSISGSVNESPVVTSMSRPRVDGDASQLILEAIFRFWLNLLVFVSIFVLSFGIFRADICFLLLTLFTLFFLW